jgi:predicted small secreted protein
MIKNKRALVVGLVVASTLLAAAFLYYFCWP